MQNMCGCDLPKMGYPIMQPTCIQIFPPQPAVICQPVIYEQHAPLPYVDSFVQNQAVPVVSPEIQISTKLQANSNKLKKDNKKLDGVKYEKLLVFNHTTMRVNTMLVWKYDNCNRQFKKSWDLLDHIRQHTGEKPYNCEKCHKKFAQRGNLVKHKRLHQQKDAVAAQPLVN